MSALKCPKCGSDNTDKIHVGAPDWFAGGQRCLDCGHKDNWGEFCEPPIRLPGPPLVEVVTK
jgi:hypothetical protein